MNIVNNKIATRIPTAIRGTRGASVVICLRIDILLVVFVVVFKVSDGLSNLLKSN
jgi:hypothetical protein